MALRKTIPLAEVVARWKNPTTRPDFVPGYLIGVLHSDAPENWRNEPHCWLDNWSKENLEEGGRTCMCAQGDILTLRGRSPDYLSGADVPDIDLEVAKTLDIDLFRAMLLRIVNDTREGAPESVLTNPCDLLGPQAWRLIAMAELYWKVIKTENTVRKASSRIDALLLSGCLNSEAFELGNWVIDTDKESLLRLLLMEFTNLQDRRLNRSFRAVMLHIIEPLDDVVMSGLLKVFGLTSVTDLDLKAEQLRLKNEAQFAEKVAV